MASLLANPATLPVGHARANRPAAAHPFLIRQSLFVVADLCGIASGAVLAITFRFPAGPFASQHFAIAEHLGIVILYAVLICLFCHTQKLYTAYQPASFKAEFTAILKSISMATLLLGGCLFLTGVKSTSRLIIAAAALSAILTMTAWRQYRRRKLKLAVADGLTCHNVVIIGTNHLAHTVAQHLALQRQLGFVVLGHLAVNGHGNVDENVVNVGQAVSPAGSETVPGVSLPGSPSLVSSPTSPHLVPLKIIGTLQNLKTICRTHFIDEILICTHDRQTVMQVIAEARECRAGVRVIPDLYDGLAWDARLDYLGDFPSLTVVHRPTPALAMTLKRLLDIVGSACALVLLSPLHLLLALIIKLDSRGPVFYASKRLGKKGRPFSCYKFRTMVTNADALKETIQHLNEREGIFFKIAKDPRITRAGRFLRKHSLDELPQFWNVLKGDMSLVGPRPPLENEVKKYDHEYLRRLDVAPGITGLWQVEARNHPSFERCMSLDVQYIENWSLALDFHILYRTVAVVLAGTGS